MRVLAATLAVLLLVAICSLAEADLRISKRAAVPQMQKTKPIMCCLSYTSHRVPRSMIYSAYRISSSCPVPAVVLVTRKGREVCVNPEAHWVQQYLTDLELQEYGLFPAAAPGQ